MQGARLMSHRFQPRAIAAAAAAAGVHSAGTAGAFDLPWISKKKDEAVSQSVAANNPAVAGGLATPPATGPAAVAPAAAPNYRAIVEQYGPAVVGVTVEGMHQAAMGARRAPQGMPPG